MKINLNNINFKSVNALKKAETTIPAKDTKVQTNPLTQNYAYPIFRGKTLAKLYEEYNWYIHHDKTPAIKSFLKINEKPEVLDNFLTEILKTADRSKEFLDSFIYNPREVVEIMNALKEKVGSNSKNLMTFMHSSPYNRAYSEYLKSKFENEKCIESLLKLRPDLRGNKLIKKYYSNPLHANTAFQIGNIPKEIPQNHLEKITEYLRNETEYGMKFDKKIQSLTLDNRKYEFSFFTEGKSSKNVFGIFTPEGKKYVLKMDRPEMKSLDKEMALGTLAKIDFYLTAHRCRNSAPLCYYNHDKNFSIYKYIEHVQIENPTNNLSEISSHLNDFQKLGMTYNDNVGYKNFFKLKENSTDGINNTEGFLDGIKNNEWITVDNDHVTYSNAMQPMISEYCSTLPNGMQMFF